MKTINTLLWGALMFAMLPQGLKAQNPNTTAANATMATQAADSLSAVLSQARQGDAEAQNTLGTWYYQGKYVKQDYAQAVYWWIESSKQNHAEAIAHLGDCYRTGHGVEADTGRAKQLYVRSVRSGYKALLDTLAARASQGEVVSSLALAQCHHNGYGTKRDDKEAARYYALAAKQGSVEGMREAGRLYVLMNQADDGERLLVAAIEAGDDEAAYYLGKYYFDGRGVSKDAIKAVHYLLMAANGGRPAAQYEIGNAYYRGEGVDKNLEQAFVWHHHAALQGSWPASWAVACSYKNGEGVKADYWQAFGWYVTAASNGYQNKLAKLMNGEDNGWEKSPMKSYVEAMKLYGQQQYAQAGAAFKALRKSGVEDARVMEEVCQLHGDNAKAAARSANALVKMAQTNDHAALEVARMQLTGSLLPQDVAAAVATLSRLAEKGCIAAFSCLGDIYYEGVGVKKSLDEAVKYYTMAETVHALTPMAAQRLALCYETSVGGIDKDQTHANKLHKVAATEPLKAFFALIKM